MCSIGVRTAMTEFWKEHSHEASLNEMMLDNSAEKLCEEEKPEVLGMLPAYKHVLELGAGIGRFTCEFAEHARSVIAVDFMQSFMKKNKEQNKKYGNIDFKVADITKLKLQEDSFDLVFSNWLLMYLDDEEVRNLAKSILGWLQEGGSLYLRESCFHQSGDKDRSTNPSYYRTPAMYTELFKSVSMEAMHGKGIYLFEIEFSQSIQTYVKLKNNINQICWLFKKVRHDSGFRGYKTFQEFLDSQQYSHNSILRYEKVFGKHFISTGGLETTKEFVQRLDLKAGQRVLDVGVGIGGSGFYMAETFDVEVVGVDLSSNMISIGLERANEIKENRVQFELADATKREYKPESFDVIYSRDTILHIADKAALFAKFLKWLKPGGRLLISDYCCKDGNHHSEAFNKYVAQRGYNLLSPVQYGKVIEKVGFVKVKAEDKTDMFVSVLKRELEQTENIKNDFIKEFSEEDYNSIISGWKDKLERCRQGDQRWGLFYAEKNVL